MAATTKTIRVPQGIEKGRLLSARSKSAASPIPTGMPSAAPSRAVMIDFVADHPAGLAAGHADRAQHAEFACPFEDGEHERVDDPEEADDDREREQDVEEVELVCDRRFLGR